MTTTLERPPESAVETHPVPQTDPAEQFERYDTIDTPQIAVVGFVSAILTFVVIVVAQAIFFAADGAMDEAKNVRVADSTTQQAVTQQESQLASYGWVDSGKGVVSIPIDVAMERVVREELEQQK